MTPNTDQQPLPQRDWAATLDLNRSTLTKSLVARIEEAMRAQEQAAEDIKQILAEAKGHEFKPREVQAMKKIAKLRLKDQRSQAAEQLEALQRIGRAVDFDLFDFAEAQS